jgi:hypothetical protein
MSLQNKGLEENNCCTSNANVACGWTCGSGGRKADERGVAQCAAQDFFPANSDSKENFPKFDNFPFILLV